MKREVISSWVWGSTGRASFGIHIDGGACHQVKSRRAHRATILADLNQLDAVYLNLDGSCVMQGKGSAANVAGIAIGYGGGQQVRCYAAVNAGHFRFPGLYITRPGPS
ncbi:hypothetical protein ES703_114547 [subsurface metagenome]